MSLREDYEARYRNHLVPCAKRIEDFLKDYCSELSRIDRVAARAKSVDRFMEKAQKTLASGQPRYPEPLEEIRDQIGARIIVFYLDDVKTVRQMASSYFRTIENVQLVPESTSSFGYVGIHLLAYIPSELLGSSSKHDLPSVFELQIKTLFQHAWAEANHDLAYKPTDTLSEEQLRLNALVAAQAWGADQIFQQLRASIVSPSNS